MDMFTASRLPLSPVNGKPILLNFDGAEMSSDAGLTLLREVERRHDFVGLSPVPVPRNSKTALTIELPLSSSPISAGMR